MAILQESQVNESIQLNSHQIANISLMSEIAGLNNINNYPTLNIFTTTSAQDSYANGKINIFHRGPMMGWDLGVQLTTSRGSGAQLNFSPFINTGTVSANLGTPTYKWTIIYSTSGTINTSDRSAKNDIHYLDSPQLRTISTIENNTETQFNTEDIISFIEKLQPATFVYNNNDENETILHALSNNKTELVQLGLIADDIKDEPLFNYVGATMTYDKEIEPEERDEEGNVTKEAVTEQVTTLGLKPLPLAVTALTCCKYLLNQVETLKTEIEELKK